MDIKLLVFDMDGTLLNDEGIISKATYAALKKAQEKGIRIVLASGTHTNVLAKFAKDLSMYDYGGYLVGANGAIIVQYPSMNLIKHHTIQASEVESLFNFGIAHHMEVLAFKDDSIVDAIPDQLLPFKEEYRKENNLSKEYPYTAGLKSLVHDQSIRYPKIFYSQHYYDSDGEANKVCFANEPESMDAFMPKLKDEFSSRFTISRTSNRWTECTHLTVNKGLALKEIIDFLGIKKANVMAFGDGENDVPLFKESGYGIAMENAMDVLKVLASDIAGSNAADGVAKYLEKVGLI